MQTFFGTGARNLVMVEPILLSPHINHHMLLHACGNTPPGQVFDRHYPNTAVCGGGPNTGDHVGNSLLGVGACTTLVYGWAVGGSAMVLPPDVGIALGAQHLRYIILEMHYDNPTHASGIVDNSGVRLHLAPTLATRTHQAASISIGDLALSLPDLPAQSKTTRK